jgi:hypothetical protein
MARLLPRFSSKDSPDPRWIRRVTDNLRGAFLLAEYLRSSSDGAALHFTSLRIPQAQDVQLPVPPAVFDANGPASVPVVTKLGLPG